MDWWPLFLSTVLGAVPSYWMGQHFGKKSRDDLMRELRAQSAELGAKNSLTYFERLLRNENWTREYIREEEIWVCTKDVTYQIVRGEREREFHEEWTKRFPNQHTSFFHIHLRIGNAIVKSLPFVSADEGRYTLPLPDLIADENNKVTYFWDPDTLGYLVAEVIGNFYRYKSLKEVASITRVVIHSVRRNA